MLTEKKRKAIEFLEKLVYGRESIESLNKKLSEHFGEKIEVENVSKSREEAGDPDELVDYNLMFNSENEETYGYFDIYILPMRREGHDGATMFITEIGWEFD